MPAAKHRPIFAPIPGSIKQLSGRAEVGCPLDERPGLTPAAGDDASATMTPAAASDEARVTFAIGVW